MSNTGYIKLHRQIRDCWIWEDPEPFTKRDAWIDLLMMANHDDTKTMFDGNVIIVGRGQKITSIKALAEQWKWSRHKVSHFLDLLEKDHMIEHKKDTKRTLINIVNYGIYQDSVSDEGHKKDIKRTSKGHQKDTNKNGRNNIYINTNYLDDILYHSTDESLPLADGTDWELSKEDHDEFSKLFPNVDIETEFRKMRSWCLSNSMMTQSSIRRFVTSWLSRAQRETKLKPVARSGTTNRFNQINRQDYDFKALEEALENR